MTALAAPVWVLADDRPGNVSQAVGLAQALGVPFVVKHVAYKWWARVPNGLPWIASWNVTAASRQELGEPFPRLVIAAGRRTAPVARWIKQRSKGQTKIVQLMHPDLPLSGFDMVLLPRHDRRPQAANNIETTLGALHRVTHEGLSDAAQDWRGRFEAYPEPRIALIVGGTTKAGPFTVQDAKALGVAVNAMVKKLKGSALVTTSRRTPAKAVDALLKVLEVPYYLHRWQKGGAVAENPYLAYLAMADGIVITGESMSMLSEACMTGVPVFVVDQGKYISTKHRRFHQQLYHARLARPFDGVFREYDYMPLDEAGRVARVIRDRWPDVFAG